MSIQRRLEELSSEKLEMLDSDGIVVHPSDVPSDFISDGRNTKFISEIPKKTTAFALFLLCVVVYQLLFVKRCDQESAFLSIQCRLGEELRHPVTSTPWKPTDRNAHRFRLPDPASNSLLCVPQKNGNRNWAGFVYYLWNHHPPKDVDDVLEAMPYFDEVFFAGNVPVTSSDHILLIARNPYVRLLSLYMQKQLNIICVDGDENCSTGFYDQMLGQHSDTFDEFVENLYKQSNKSGTIACRTIEDHFCPQVAGCNFQNVASVTILKLERESQWFPCLGSTLGLTLNDVSGEQWTSFAGQPCFYTADGDCSHALTPLLSSGVAVGPVHGTSAAASVSKHYTKKAAQLVSEIYKEDFELLGYQIWDGEGDLPMF